MPTHLFDRSVYSSFNEFRNRAAGNRSTKLGTVKDDPLPGLLTREETGAYDVTVLKIPPILFVW